MKKFAKDASEIKSLAEGHGGCIATDRITVDGLKVGYMCREETNIYMDSGWRFFAGDESEAYKENEANIEVYNINTIANYDADIIPHLNSPVGAAFIRTEQGLVPDPKAKTSPA